MDPREINRCIDRVATLYARVPSPGEIERAREEFDAARGKVYDDDELHATHMGMFLEWYVLERALDGGGTPAERALGEPELLAELDADLLLALSRGQRALLEVVEAQDRALELVDLLLGGRWCVALDAPMTGIEPGEIFEARLIPWQGEVRLGPLMCYHPRSARETILDILDDARQQGEPGPELADALAEMRLRYSRFRNIAVEHIYSTAPFARQEAKA